jgi:hypothetical protein
MAVPQVYLTNLEIVKSAMYAPAYRITGTEAGAAGMSNFVGGAFASLVSQSVAVPVDVITQRLMVAGANLGGCSVLFFFWIISAVVLCADWCTGVVCLLQCRG